jgi:uncharacterized membrane-anchored protein YitT (DUF2179 family)
MSRSFFLQLVGLGIAAIGLGLIFPPAGVIAAGVALFAVGFVHDQVPR